MLNLMLILDVICYVHGQRYITVMQPKYEPHYVLGGFTSPCLSGFLYTPDMNNLGFLSPTHVNCPP